jgi:hypothetical protein
VIEEILATREPLSTVAVATGAIVLSRYGRLPRIVVEIGAFGLVILLGGTLRNIVLPGTDGTTFLKLEEPAGILRIKNLLANGCIPCRVSRDQTQVEMRSRVGFG